MNTSNGNRATETGNVSVATINSAGWGVFFIWVGIALVVDVGWGVALLGTGVIMLGAQGIRTLFALKLDPGGVAVGTCMVVAGLLRWLDIPSDRALLPSWLIPGLFVASGVAILASIWIRRHKD